MTTALQLMVDGLVLGALLAVAASGLGLILGVLRMINVAHGDMITVGAFIGLTLVTAGAPILVALVGAMLVVGALSVVIDKALWKPMRRRSVGAFSFLLLSVGLAYVIRYVVFWIYGSGTRRYYPPEPNLSIGPVGIGKQQLLILAASLVALVFLLALLRYTSLGMDMRAMADNRDLARVSGINVDRLSSRTALLAGLLAGYAGVLIGLNGRVYPNIGWNLLLLVMAAVIVGGIGTASGAIVGGFVIGVAQELSTHPWIGVPAEMKQAAAFFVLIVVLIVRPQGIMGNRRTL